MPSEKQDLRVIKTHNAIRTAFIALLQENAYENISVQDILDKALVNRNTFYKYYSGKSALAGAMIEDFRHRYEMLMNERFSTNVSLNKLLEISAQLFDYRNELLALWAIKTKRHHLYDDMFFILKEKFIRYAQSKYPSTQPQDWDYQGELFATMMAMSSRYYFSRNQPVPIKEMLKHWQQVIDLSTI
ncbi:TetR/AcrR family transcriptional regulator [Moraxella sp. ZJ142]|uniref:TetR/AcrR family transcriptional regulator n=1 Tax=Moraxella marmotae TaxID=3344520 RepID=UPI0035D5275F